MIFNIVILVWCLFLLVLIIGGLLKIEQQEKRILDIEKRWADFRRRNFDYKNLGIPPTDKNDNLRRLDIELKAEAERAKLRNHGIIVSE